MASESRRSAVKQPASPVRFAAARPADPRGAVSAGQIVKLFVGQGYGYIKRRDGREVYFHRADVVEGSINDLAVGDPVKFELLEDRLSGARALFVRRSR